MTAAFKLNLTARTIAIALLGLTVLVLGAGWFVVVSPKRSEASKLAATVSAKQSELAAAQHAQHANTSVHAVSSRLAGKALPDELLMPDIVDQLSSLAARSGVVLDTVTPSTATPGIGYEAVPLSVVVDGHYFAVERFLNLMRNQVRLANGKLQASGRLFDVQGVQLQQTEPAPMITATVSAQAFYYSAAAATPAPTQTTTDSTTTTG